MQTIFAFALAGFLLLVGEVFIPGMILGALGFICLFIAICTSYVIYGPLTGTWIFAIIGLFYSIGLLIWLKIFPRTTVGTHISNRKALPSPLPEKRQMLGAQGTAISMLRPAGIALFDGQRRDVITEGSFIEPNTPLIVVAENGQNLVVRAMNSYDISSSKF
jgi:membrane-bound serine protease (ClpP class)